MLGIVDDIGAAEVVAGEVGVMVGIIGVGVVRVGVVVGVLVGVVGTAGTEGAEETEGEGMGDIEGDRDGVTIGVAPLDVAREREGGEDDSVVLRDSISGLFALGLFFSNSSISCCNWRCASPYI